MAFTLPTYVADPTLLAGNVYLPEFIADPTLSTGNARLPAFVLTPTLLAGNIYLPEFSTDIIRVPQITVAGAATQKDYGFSSFPLITISAAGIAGQAGSSSISVPLIALSATGVSEAIRQIPHITIAASAVTGTVTNQFQNTLVIPSITATGETLNIIAGNSVLPQIILAAQGQTGTLATATITLPLISMVGAGYEPQIGSASVTIPLIIMQATGYTAAGVTHPTIVMQTQNLALTEYTNYPFNSFAKFNGIYLGASGTGIFALTGATDAGTIIDAAARVGTSDFGTSHLKEVDRMYIGYRSDGEMVLRVFTDEIHVRDYLVKNKGLSGLHVNRVQMGKGVIARYYQFEIQNRNGSDFELDVMEVKPTVLKRRVSGGNP